MVTRMMASARAVRREDGQALVEYVLILGLISIVAVALLTAVGTSVQDLLSHVSDVLVSAV
jgi:Flp pilus assembly pilin Flp